MNGFLLVIYAALAITYGVRGNAGKVGALVAKDAPFYVPWLVSIAFLVALNSNDKTKPFVNPFVALIVLGLLVNKRSVIFPEAQHIVDHYTKGTQL